MSVRRDQNFKTIGHPDGKSDRPSSQLEDADLSTHVNLMYMIY